MTQRRIVDSPLGPLTLEAQDGALTALRLGACGVPEGEDSALLLEAQAQLAAYFAGSDAPFSLPLHPAGTAFQLAVWRALTRVPCGQTRTYAWLAEAAGRPGACRAAGTAAGKNPLPILIPCHRILRADGGLGGFSLGLHVKQYLLELEHGRK